MSPLNKAAFPKQPKQTSHPAKMEVKRPTAPPVYRPQQSNTSVQPKTAQKQEHPAPYRPQSINQQRPVPVAPPIYRPQLTPKVLQPKMAGAHQQTAGKSLRHPPAPPVYRPEPKKLVQPKMAAGVKSRTLHKAPPKPSQNLNQNPASQTVQPMFVAKGGSRRPPVYRPSSRPRGQSRPIIIAPDMRDVVEEARKNPVVELKYKQVEGLEENFKEIKTFDVIIHSQSSTMKRGSVPMDAIDGKDHLSIGINKDFPRESFTQTLAHEITHAEQIMKGTDFSKPWQILFAEFEAHETQAKSLKEDVSMGLRSIIDLELVELKILYALLTNNIEGYVYSTDFYADLKKRELEPPTNNPMGWKWKALPMKFPSKSTMQQEIVKKL